MRRGVDVSKWQGEVRWQVTASRGIEIAYIRGAYGLEKDPYYALNWKAAPDAGIERGVYLYPLYAIDFNKQMDYWLRSLPNVEHGERRPYFDIEFNKGERKPDGLYQPALLKLLARAEREFGVKPGIYSSPAVIRAYLKMPEFGEYPLFIANYVETSPGVPLPWLPLMWEGWQVTSKGNGLYYGASSKSIDLDVFQD